VGYDVFVNLILPFKDEERDSTAGENILQRVGDGVSPTDSHCVKITRELPAEWIITRLGRVSSVNGKAYAGTCKIGGIARELSSCLQGGGFFIFGGFNMYKKVSTNMNFVQREKEVLQFWTDNKVFEQTLEQSKQGETYTL